MKFLKISKIRFNSQDNCNQKYCQKSQRFFDNIDKWAKEQGASGLAYFSLEKDKSLSAKGPIGKFFSEDSLKELMKICDAELGDSFLSLWK